MLAWLRERRALIMAKPLQYLTAPGRIGALTLKNRMVVTAMGANLAEADASCGERIIAYHERQARGGAGLIITGVSSVDWPNGAPIPAPIGLSDDRFLPGLERLAEAVHRHGAKIAAQWHHGLGLAVAGLFRGAAGVIALDEE